MARAAENLRIVAKRPEWLPPFEDKRAEEILLAAFNVFMERGFEGATMLEIATRAKVSKLTIYALFKDKEGLFEALVAWGCKRYELDANALSDDPDPRHALEAYAIAFTRVMLRWQSMALFRIAVSQAPSRPRVAAIHRELTRRERQSSLLNMAQRLEAAGLIGKGEAGEFAGDFIAMMRGEAFYDVLSGTASPPGKAEVERHVKRALKRLLKAYAPAPMRAKRRAT